MRMSFAIISLRLGACEASSKPLCKRKGALEPFTFVAVLKSERTIAIDQAQELSVGSVANSRCISADIFQGKN